MGPLWHGVSMLSPVSAAFSRAPAASCHCPKICAVCGLGNSELSCRGCEWSRLSVCVPETIEVLPRLHSETAGIGSTPPPDRKWMNVLGPVAIILILRLVLCFVFLMSNNQTKILLSPVCLTFIVVLFCASSLHSNTQSEK